MKTKPGHILLGCVADDFTGASDAASFLAGQGVKTLLFNGIPKETDSVRDCACIVIALKTRSIPAADAVKSTLEAVKWLQKHQAAQIYLKYCSTFDSTPEGNIGPDIDAVLEHLHLPYTLLCPSLPVNRRIVKDGVLIADGIPIAEGPMARHPLNPIWASHIGDLMKPQGRYPCMILNGELLTRTKEQILSEVQAFGRGKKHFYIIPDYSTDEQGEKIARVFGGHKLLTGGSGLLKHLAALYKEAWDCTAGKQLPCGVPGRGLILSGSCSTATEAQCRAYEAEHPALSVYPSKLLSGSQSIDSIWHMADRHGSKEPLIYSAGATDPDSRNYADKEQAACASLILEETMAQLGKRALENGYTRLVAAGGETSGAVALALGFHAFIVGESIAPGVPILIPLQNQNIRIALKSGNFGDRDFFSRALAMMRGDEGRKSEGEEEGEKASGNREAENDRPLMKLKADACWIGKSLFERNKTSGSSANMSFLYQDRVYITEGGSCFGRLTADSFAVTDLEGAVQNQKLPSKELPLHLALYRKPGSTVRAVIHIHSSFAVLWSCLSHDGREDNVVPPHTPYLTMKLGSIRLVPYEKPGSRELFAAFRERLGNGGGYLLARHGPVVGASSLMEAFYNLEELEESCRTAWELHKLNIPF